MPAFRDLEPRALLTSFGLIDSWMLIVPPLAVSSLAITHLSTIPGWKRWGKEKISCDVKEPDIKNNNKQRTPSVRVYSRHPPLCLLNPAVHSAAWCTSHWCSWCWGSLEDYRADWCSPQSLTPLSHSLASAFPPSNSENKKVKKQMS